MVCKVCVTIALQYARSGIPANPILPGMMNMPMVHAPEVIVPLGYPRVDTADLKEAKTLLDKLTEAAIAAEG
jgi:hypothetical protein